MQKMSQHSLKMTISITKGDYKENDIGNYY